MEPDVEQAEVVVGPHHPHVLVRVGLPHALCWRKEFPLRPMHDARLCIPIGLQWRRHKGHGDESHSLHLG